MCEHRLYTSNKKDGEFKLQTFLLVISKSVNYLISMKINKF